MNQKKINIPPAIAFILIFAPVVSILEIQLMGMLFSIQWGVAWCGLDCADFEEYWKRINDFGTGATFAVMALLFYSVLALVLFSMWYRMAFHKDEKFINPFKGLAKRPLLFAVGLVVFVVGAQYLCSYIAEGLGIIFPSWLERYLSVMEDSGLTGDQLGFLGLLYAVILGPTVEEIAFRGLSYHYARICMPVWAANILQALLFGVIHGNMLQGSFAFVLGLLLGYVYEKYHNLTVTIMIHILYNGFAFLLEFISEKVGNAESVTNAMGQDLFSNPAYATSFAIFFFLSMVMTYIGSQLLAKATVEKEVKISE